MVFVQLTIDSICEVESRGESSHQPKPVKDEKVWVWTSNKYNRWSHGHSKAFHRLARVA